MTEQPSIRFYETSLLREITQETLRPGGLTITNRALEFCDFPLQSNLLDIGCGTGATQALLENYGFRSFGIDASSLVFRQNPWLSRSAVQAVGESIPLVENSMDGVFLECTLSVVKSPRTVLQECTRLLKKGGLLILTDVFARNEYGIPALRATIKNLCFNFIWSQMEINAMIQTVGLNTLIWEDHSKAIRDFTGKAILTQGSMDSFWQKQFSSTGNKKVDPLNFQLLLSRARIGYFMLIAQKK
jgi:arsenite methyltransferase